MADGTMFIRPTSYELRANIKGCDMINKSFIFLAGHHRSGTSLLHEIIREHHLISGFSNTGVPEDEGQHLQNIFKPAKAYGGPGKYIFNKNSHMTEDHNLATDLSAEAIMRQWEKHYDASCEHYIEKSLPNLIRTRFFQKLFPNSKFIAILRNPLVVSFATQKWSKTSLKSLIHHTLLGYEIFMNDMDYLRNVYVLRYEDFVANPQNEIDKVYDFLNLESLHIQHTVKPDVNEKYFSMWETNRKTFLKRLLLPVNGDLEKRANKFGYSIRNYRNLPNSPILDMHNKALHSDGNP